MSTRELDRFRGAILGLACGDALGAPVEFKPRGSFSHVTDFADGGPFNLKKGQWTDDTSLALCLAHSLIEKNGFDPYDQIEKYCQWFRQGYMSCTGHCFDIGNTTKAALLRYEANREIYAGSEDDPASNGSLMRLAPVALFFYPDLEKTTRFAALSSKITHAPKECIFSCEVLALLIFCALKGESKLEMRKRIDDRFLAKTYDQLSGKGEATSCLEAALWCFFQTESFEEGLIKAVNLGDDTDTTGAVFGQLAGAHYGEKNIPTRWLEQLHNQALLIFVAEGLYNKKFSSNAP